VKLQDWYLGLVEREQRMVLWGGIAAGVLLLAGLVWQLGASVAKAEERVERRRQDLAFIESVTPRLQTLPAARPGEPLTIAVDRMAREGGLADKLAAVEPASNGALRARFTGASFDSLTLLLPACRRSAASKPRLPASRPPANPASSTRRSSSTAADRS
jgi:type II secretory pathway component PulM